MRTFTTLIVGIILGVAAVIGGVYFYFATGQAPVATSSEPMPFERKLAHKALNALVDREMPRQVPIQPDQPNLTAGAQTYRENCAVCHGLPGQQETFIAKGMYPRPPKLMEGKGVTDDEPGESYWKVANGIRLTGMPGYRNRLTDTQMWQVALLVANADKLPKPVQDILTIPLATNQAAQAATAK
ncbi:MAG TPA: cytochrome c [Candidatus Binatia bacterium]|nr:cytochrome c [Candidatus Binatia bacterium]